MLIGIDASRAARAKPTGTERYAQQIIEHLIHLPAADRHRWRLYVDGPAPEVAHWASAQHVEHCLLPWGRLWTHRMLAREVIRHPPDVLFVPAHVLPFVWPADRLPPSVVTIHDLGYCHVPHAHTRRQRLYLDWSTRWSVHVAGRVIAVSHATAADLQHFYGTPAARIQVVHEATDPIHDMATEPRQQVAERYDLQRPYALYVGTIQPRKNLARLMEAYSALQAAGDGGFDLVLAGKPGWQSDPLLARAQGYSGPGRIHLVGYVPDRDLPALLSNALFFCFPSLFEGFGLPVLEAQSYGVPVMTASNSSLPEVAGDAAILVDPTDTEAIARAMLQLSQDEALRRRLIEAGFRNVERFSWEKAARETLRVLEEAAGHN